MGVKVTINDKVLAKVQGKLEQRLKRAVDDCADDLVRVSSETAPHDKGILEKSFAKEVQAGPDNVTATVSYTIRERRGKKSTNFNYAIIMHEGEYKLGPGSENKPGGVGMSDKHYPVGSKFLTRPLEGEKEAYRKHIEAELQDLIKKGG
ncbi:hypothetical protein [Heliophilum fasciatum]|uniref:HK97 gp10 family phage protein n=1 Tax=Heliophilum fasciatum TaxID=35700 RepID=A0A4R2RTR1_9FIRM|nr:hypothetical protein [Heliophilum fasciatum]MCW2278736.1 hypothetical protein [Heliophilum fasciatum]TCP62525.1 hypothetical protein EDD73_12123 [Heliophilum fasciatum]